MSQPPGAAPIPPGPQQPAQPQYGQPTQPDYTQPQYGQPTQPDYTQPQYGQPTQPGYGGPAAPTPSPRNGGIIAGAIIGGLVLLGLMGWGVSQLLDDADTSEGAQTSEGVGSESGPCTAICVTSSTALEDSVTTDSGVVWTLSTAWQDVESPAPGALSAAQSTWESELGTLTLVTMEYGSADEAGAGSDALMAELGTPVFEGSVWSNTEDGVRRDFESDDGRQNILWYDSTGYLHLLDSTISGPELFDFYLALPF
ncbi:MAG: hypothetical protein ACK5KU_10425 [Beutenbergiaceae bacterium]